MKAILFILGTALILANAQELDQNTFSQSKIYKCGVETLKNVVACFKGLNKVTVDWFLITVDLPSEDEIKGVGDCIKNALMGQLKCYCKDSKNKNEVPTAPTQHEKETKENEDKAPKDNKVNKDPSIDGHQKQPKKYQVVTAGEWRWNPMLSREVFYPPLKSMRSDEDVWYPDKWYTAEWYPDRE